LVLQSLAAAEITNIPHSRDFRSPAIFDFFNSIGAKRTFAKYRRRLSAVTRAQLIADHIVGANHLGM
jgi:hypothetical protein